MGERFVSLKSLFFIKFQALATRGLVFAPTTKSERISAGFTLDKNSIFFPVVLLVVSVWLWDSYATKCGTANQSSRKCAGKKYFLSEDLARAAKLQVGSTVCRVHWGEI